MHVIQGVTDQMDQILVDFIKFQYVSGQPKNSKQTMHDFVILKIITRNSRVMRIKTTIKTTRNL